MRSVTRFPSYHQRENVITNHVMVMLRTLYDHSPRLLDALLQVICDSEVNVGAQFSQQFVGVSSVPDGLILQEPLAVFIETKLHDGINADQLYRHCQTIVDRLPGQKGSFLISLTSGKPNQQPIPESVMMIALQNNITVTPVTFGELVECIGKLPVTDLALKETIQEFSDFIFAQQLIPREHQYMVAMLTGRSWRGNLEYGVYFEPDDRNAKWLQSAFLGLYHDKMVSHVGRITAAVIAVKNQMGSLDFDDPETGEINDAGRQAIQNIIGAAQIYYPEFESSRHRYYIVDSFSETDFRKITPGGLMGHRYFDLNEISGNPIPSSAAGGFVAEALRGLTFGSA